MKPFNGNLTSSKAILEHLTPFKFSTVQGVLLLLFGLGILGVFFVVF